MSENRRDATRDIVSGTSGVLAELLTPGIPGVGAGATLAVSTAIRLGEAALERRRRRMGCALEAAADILDVGLHILEERALEYDARLELLAQVLEAAAKTPMEEKLRGLGKVLALGYQDDTADISRAAVLAAALADVEAPHVRILALLRAEPTPGADVPQSNTRSGWNLGQLNARLPGDADILPAVVAVLAGHGLILDAAHATWDFIPHYTISALGQRCLELLDG
ncbi:hypothetical protein [Kribbella jiaozuonensis]|uniref:Uncharacterized protein n=1 Tax=Kribbella jiaozuonensis TaxID=2575441 RepID=A0A4U3LVI2_9ACTN|nr:hypothetical protein [Kribbella jiaozuonensis]TKK80125.1 hypothetical protein FDA38_17470 [Kribbella jiaozuonensis]